MINSLLKTLRWKNLLFIALIQSLMRFAIIKPILAKYGIMLLFSNFNFILLVASTLLIAAGGNVINDYFDYELDTKFSKRSHHPKITKNLLFALYLIFSFIGIILGFYVSFAVHFYKLGYIFILVAGLLWFYSSSYKSSFLLGNAIISILAGVVPLIVLPYEMLLQYNINKQYLVSIGQNLSEISHWVIGYSIFAFWFTLMREIVKDCEDFDADLNFNYNTMPLVLGLKKTNIISFTLSIISILAVSFVIIKFTNNIITYIYASLFVILPMIYFTVKILKAETNKQYHLLSTLLKIVMLIGILYTIVSNFKNLIL